jgi:hypothetical protein
MSAKAVQPQLEITTPGVIPLGSFISEVVHGTINDMPELGEWQKLLEIRDMLKTGAFFETETRLSIASKIREAANEIESAQNFEIACLNAAIIRNWPNGQEEISGEELSALQDEIEETNQQAVQAEILHREEVLETAPLIARLLQGAA